MDDDWIPATILYPGKEQNLHSRSGQFELQLCDTVSSAWRMFTEDLGGNQAKRQLMFVWTNK